MDIRKARKIANDILSNYKDEDLHTAFHRLDRSAMAWNDADKALAKKIWDHYGSKT